MIFLPSSTRAILAFLSRGTINTIMLFQSCTHIKLINEVTTTIRKSILEEVFALCLMVSILLVLVAGSFDSNLPVFDDSAEVFVEIVVLSFAFTRHETSWQNFLIAEC